MQNNGKEMYKCVLHVQSCFLLIRVSIDFFVVVVLVAVAVQYYTIIIFLVWVNSKYINESFAYSRD